MLLLRTDSLPSGEQWLYELKLDGYRAIAYKRNGAVHLRSRNDNDFNARYPGVVAALAKLPVAVVLFSSSDVVLVSARAGTITEWL